MEKIYNCMCYSSKDEGLIPRVKISSYMNKISKENPNDQELENNWKDYYKSICNNIRKSWNIEGIIALAYSKEENSVFVYEFPVKADNTIFSPVPIWDDEIKRYYIEM